MHAIVRVCEKRFGEGKRDRDRWEWSVLTHGRSSCSRRRRVERRRRLTSQAESKRWRAEKGEPGEWVSECSQLTLGLGVGGEGNGRLGECLSSWRRRTHQGFLNSVADQPNGESVQVQFSSPGPLIMSVESRPVPLGPLSRPVESVWCTYQEASLHLSGPKIVKFTLIKCFKFN